MSVGTQDPLDALERAREMQGPGSTVTITDRHGNKHTIEELEAGIRSGRYAKPACSTPR